MVQKVFLKPFAIGGDAVPPIPDARQSDGTVSYDTGFGVDYERQLGVDPQAKNIRRTAFNALMLDVTTALQEMQSGHGISPYSAELAAALPGGGYPVGAFIPRAVGAGFWLNTVAANFSDPDSTASVGWIAISGQGSDYALDTGTFTNKYVVAYAPAVIQAPADGMLLRFIATSASISGNATLKVNDLPERRLLNSRYATMQAGQIAIGSACTVQFVQALNAWVLVCALGNAIPTTLAGYGITDAYTKAQVDALVGTGTKVVGNPVVTGSSSVTSGTVVTLTATATSLLAGGSIASFTWILPDGSQSTTPATSNSATKNVTATGSIGTNYVVKVFATDNAGNISQQTTKSIAITNHNAPTAPTTLSVAPTIYQSSTGNQLTVSGSTASDGATITYSLSQSGAAAVTFSKTTGIAANEVVTFTAPSVAADTPLTISAVAVDSMGGVSAPTSVNVTIAAVPTQAGVAYGGGYYVGRIKPGDGNTYALIVAPKASGQSATTLAIKTSATSTPGTTSTWDGAANTAAMIAAGAAAHPAANFCKGLTIGGYSDWFLPAKDQLELCYRNLKPTTQVNDAGYGVNPNSDPVGVAYTAGNPVQTSVTAFKAGGAEAFDTNTQYYASNEGTSTDYSKCWTQFFPVGQQGLSIGKTSPYNVRAVRMIKI